MAFNDETIGCYVEGHCNPSELKEVRKYLRENPEQLERILIMMDTDHYFTELSPRVSPKASSDYLDISIAAAAFSPLRRKSSIEPSQLKDGDILKNISKMYDELESI